MRTLVFSIFGLCLADAALAQDDAPIAFIPRFDGEPSAAELVRRYPPEALQQNVSGIAVLCCTPNEDRSVACAVSSEWPEGNGFGAASVQASQSYRLAADSHADLAARPGTQVRISMLWAGPVISPETVQSLQRRDMETMHACLPPVTAD